MSKLNWLKSSAAAEMSSEAKDMAAASQDMASPGKRVKSSNSELKEGMMLPGDESNDGP